MEYIFSRRDLSYLDDIMPELVKKSIEDDQEENSGNNNRTTNQSISIGQELSKTKIWKDLAAGEINKDTIANPISNTLAETERLIIDKSLNNQIVI